jgi:hypothetical protein
MKVNRSAVRIMLDQMTNEERDVLVARLIENVERLNERIEELENERQAMREGNKY